MPELYLTDLFPDYDVSLPAAVRPTGITMDSRAVQPGFVFVAVPGWHTDGHRYIDQAIANGAVAIIHEQALSSTVRGISYIRVANSRLAISQAAAVWHHQPSKSLRLLA